MEAEKDIDLISSDGGRIKISSKAAQKSKMLKGVLDDFPDSTEIPVPKVNTEILTLIKDFLEYYQDKDDIPKIERPLKDKDFAKCVSDEYQSKFMNVELKTIFDLINGANFLDIPAIQELASAKVASIIKGVSTEEIRKAFNLPQDFTQEEEKQIVEENKWCMDNL